MSWKFNSIPPKRLSETITSSSTSFKLNNILGFDGVALTNAIVGDYGYGSFQNPSGTILELFTYDVSTIASSSITFLKRGLTFTEDGTETEVSANKLTWVKGVTIVNLGTDAPAMYAKLKTYIDAAAIAGGVPATTTVLGLNKMSVAPVSAGSPIAVGDNDTRIPTAAQATYLSGVASTTGIYYAADSVGTDAYAVTLSPAPASYTTGMMLNIKVATANTGACTINVNSLGVKNIKKDVSSDPETGDILANQIVTLVYDGTNFQVASRTTPLTTPVVRTYLNAASPATWTKPAGLKYVTVEVQAAGGGGGGARNSSGTAGNAAGAGGGGGGGYSKKTIAAATLGSTETVTIGANGTAGIGGSPSTNGGTGGSVSFGSHCSATGGSGGTKADQGEQGASGGTGGVGSGGDINSKGSGGGAGAARDAATGGGGGSSFFGGGAEGKADQGVGVAGSNGSSYGGGGGGAAERLSSGTNDGGTGGAAIVIVTEYYN